MSNSVHQDDSSRPNAALAQDILGAISPGLVVEDQHVIARVGRPSRLLADVQPPMRRVDLPDWLRHLIDSAIETGEAATLSDHGARVLARSTSISRPSSTGGDAAPRWLITLPNIDDEEESREQGDRRFWNTHPVEPIVNASPFLVCYLDRNLMYRYANEAYLQYWGRSRDEIVGRHVGDVIPRHHLEKFRPLIERVMGGETVEMEIRSDVTGTTRFFRATHSPDIAPDGSVIGLFLFSVEITQIKEQETKVRQILENVPACYLHLDRNLTLKYATQGSLDIIGDDFSSFIGRPFAELWGGELFDEILPALKTALNGRVASYTTQLLRPDKPPAHLLFYVVPEIDLDGHVIGLYNVGFDITPVRRMKREIQIVRERLDRAVQGSLLGVWEIDSSQPDWIYGEHLEKLLELPPGSLHDSITEFLEHVDPQDRDAVEAFLSEAHQTAQPREIEFRVHTQDGASRWMRAMCEPTVEDGERMQKVVGTILDIDQLKRAQSALEDQVRQRDMFLAMLAHELRNPLTAIYHAVYIAKTSGALPQTLEPVFDIIDRQSRQLSRLVEDLLDISRLTQNKLKFQFERIDLAEIAHHAAWDMKARIEEKQQTLVVDVGREPVWIRGDAGRLSQAITNLLDNASKYTPAKGRIQIGMDVDQRSVRVHVIDTGQGIDPENQKRVFELFFQPDQPLHRSSGGLGVGLYLVRSVIEHHGGTIAAKSAGPGKGTTVTFELPRIDDSPESAESDQTIRQEVDS